MQVATTFGIPIRLHWSFLLLVGGYVAFTTATSGAAGGRSTALLAIALFGSVLLHELGHALAARWYGIGTESITLYPFGGIAAIETMPSEPRQELVIALAGPAVNFALAGVFGLAWFLGGLELGVWAMLTAINLVMGIFNLLPAYPMDGGRVLRALLAGPLGWFRATDASIRIGRAFAWLFLAGGLVLWSPGLLLVAGFLHLALLAERRRLVVALVRHHEALVRRRREALAAVPQGVLRHRDPEELPREATLSWWRLVPPDAPRG